MSTTKLISSCFKVSELLETISKEFTINSSQIILNPNEEWGLDFIVTVPTSSLATKNWSDLDYNDFCYNNNLSGSIIFNSDNTVSFNMTPHFHEEKQQYFLNITEEDIDNIINNSSAFLDKFMENHNHNLHGYSEFKEACDNTTNCNPSTLAPKSDFDEYYSDPEREANEKEMELAFNSYTNKLAEEAEKSLEELDEELDALFSKSVV